MKPIMIIQNGKLVSESKLFRESLSIEYKVPEDRETRIYDFYTLALYDSLLRHKATVQAGLLKPGWDEDTVADLKAYVHDGMELISQELKRDLLDATALSISAELRHAFDREENHERVLESAGDLKEKLQKFYSKLVQQKALSKSPEWLKQARNWREKGQTKDYTIAKRAFDRSGLDYQELAEIGAKVFMLPIWPGSFGGTPWKNICLGLARLDKANKIDEIISATDHILDLEHNTGVMLNKVKRFSKNGGFMWIKEALDFKFKARPWELAQKSSISSAVIGRLNRLTGADVGLEKYQDEVKDNAIGDSSDILSKDIFKKLKPFFSTTLNIKGFTSVLINEAGNIFYGDGGDLKDFVKEKLYPNKNLPKFDKAFRKMLFHYNVINFVKKENDDTLAFQVKTADPSSRITKDQLATIRSLIDHAYSPKEHHGILVSFEPFDSDVEEFKGVKNGLVSTVDDAVKFFKQRNLKSVPKTVQDNSKEDKSDFSFLTTPDSGRGFTLANLLDPAFGENLKDVWKNDPNGVEVFTLDKDGYCIDVGKEFTSYSGDFSGDILQKILSYNNDKFIMPKSPGEQSTALNFLLDKRELAFLIVHNYTKNARFEFYSKRKKPNLNQVKSIIALIQDHFLKKKEIDFTNTKIKCKENGELDFHIKGEIQSFTAEDQSLSISEILAFLKGLSGEKDKIEISKEEAIGDYFFEKIHKSFKFQKSFIYKNTGCLVDEKGKCLPVNSDFLWESELIKNFVHGLYEARNISSYKFSEINQEELLKNFLSFFKSKNLIFVRNKAKEIGLVTSSGQELNQKQIAFLATYTDSLFGEYNFEYPGLKVVHKFIENTSAEFEKYFLSLVDLKSELDTLNWWVNSNSKQPTKKKENSKITYEGLVRDIESGFTRFPMDGGIGDFPISLAVNSIGRVQKVSDVPNFPLALAGKYYTKDLPFKFSTSDFQKNQWIYINVSENRLELSINDNTTRSQKYVIQSIAKEVMEKMFSKHKVIYFRATTNFEKMPSGNDSFSQTSKDCKSPAELKEKIATLLGMSYSKNPIQNKQNLQATSPQNKADQKAKIHALISKYGKVQFTGQILSDDEKINSMLLVCGGIVMTLGKNELSLLDGINPDTTTPVFSFLWSKENFPDQEAKEAVRSVLQKAFDDNKTTISEKVLVLSKGVLHYIAKENIPKYLPIIANKKDAV